MIYIILDRSGSMSGKENDVIGGVNSFIADQKKLPDPASIALIRFDSVVERFRAMQALAEALPLTGLEYQPRGMTALVDAVGMTLNEAEKDWVAERPDRAIMVIVTDGQENSSREFTKAKLKEMIQAREKSGLWAFIYLGANVDAFGEASSLGINLQNAAGYTASSAGIGSTYSTVSESVHRMRATGATAAHNLGGTINEDGTLSKKSGKSATGTSQDPVAAIKAKIDAAQQAKEPPGIPVGPLRDANGNPKGWIPPTSTTADPWKPPF